MMPHGVALEKPRRGSPLYMIFAAVAVTWGCVAPGAASPLATRVAADFPGRSGAAFYHYAVPATSGDFDDAKTLHPYFLSIAAHQA